MNTIINSLKDHTSIRKFNDHPISDEQIDAIIQSAKQGATAGNMMLYSIIKIKSKETLSKLAVSCDDQPFIADAQFALLFVVDHHKWNLYFESKNLKNRFEDYEGPSVSDFILGMQDATIAAQNAVVAAESMNIGTCYIGDIMDHYETHKAQFNLPEHTMPALLVVFGHYDHKPAVRERFDDQFVVFDEVYPAVTAEFVDEMFKRQESSTEDFAFKFYKRKKNSDFFKEMNRSIKKYWSEWK